MRPDQTPDPLKMLEATTRELSALGLRLVGYVGLLALLVTGAILLWEQLPDAVAQAREVAIMAGWTIDPPPLRGSL